MENKEKNSLTSGNNGGQGVAVKKCSRCKLDKPKTDFGVYSPSSRAAGKLKARCRACDTDIQMSWYRLHPEKIKQYNDSNYKKQKSNPEWWAKRCARKRELKLGLPPGSVVSMMSSQDGKCRICEVDIIGRKKSHIDHDHRTGKVRSLLCGNCNVLLGHARENVDLLKRVIAYIELFRG